MAIVIITNFPVITAEGLHSFAAINEGKNSPIWQHLRQTGAWNKATSLGIGADGPNWLLPAIEPFCRLIFLFFPSR